MSSKMNSSTEVEIRVVPKEAETRKSLLATVNKVELFSFLTAESREQLVDAMFEMNFTDGQVIIRQGDAPDNFYIMTEGDVDILKKKGDTNIKVAVLHPGACFGELALISGSVRSATVVAVGAVKCWAIDQTTYLGLLKERHAAKRQRYKELLKGVPALQVLPDSEILLVADALQAVSPEAGQEIVKQGEPGDEFFIILEGECRVLKQEEGETERREVAVLTTGKFFGEVALLRDVPRSATVVAGAGCKLIKLDRSNFHRLLGPLNQIFQDRIKSYTSAG
jgi:cAMP-dependent protein kinase regulator